MLCTMWWHHATRLTAAVWWQCPLLIVTWTCLQQLQCPSNIILLWYKRLDNNNKSLYEKWYQWLCWKSPQTSNLFDIPLWPCCSFSLTPVFPWTIKTLNSKWERTKNRKQLLPRFSLENFLFVCTKQERNCLLLIYAYLAEMVLLFCYSTKINYFHNSIVLMLIEAYKNLYFVAKASYMLPPSSNPFQRNKLN